MGKRLELALHKRGYQMPRNKLKIKTGIQFHQSLGKCKFKTIPEVKKTVNDAKQQQLIVVVGR